MKRTVIVLFSAACLACYAYLSGSAVAVAQDEGVIFVLSERASARSEDERSSVASRREARIAFSTKTAAEADVPSVSFPLFDQTVHRARKAGFERRSADDYTWRGKTLDGAVESDVILTFRKGRLAGLIYSGQQVYEIVPKGDDTILVELDQSLFPECGGAVAGEKVIESRSADAVLAGADSGDRIDVLVLYTASVKASLGGDAQAAVFAQQAIDATNTAYINSRIRQRVRLAGVQETAMVETGEFGTELSALRADPAAAAARNAVNADMVSMLTNSTAACGIGYLMGGSLGNQNNAFTVTARTCAVGNLSFAHELGHNMGSQHNPENGSGATFIYGYGHYINGSYRTVMSYVDPCSSGCTRRPYFSNPAVVFSGFPTGVVDARDNARSINNTADTIANYRYSGSSLTMTAFNARENFPLRVARNVTWTSDNLAGNVRIDLSRDEGQTWETLVASTANDGSETLNIYGRPTRRARLRIQSLGDPTVSDSSISDINLR